MPKLRGPLEATKRTVKMPAEVWEGVKTLAHLVGFTIDEQVQALCELAIKNDLPQLLKDWKAEQNEKDAERNESIATASEPLDPDGDGF